VTSSTAREIVPIRAGAVDWAAHWRRLVEEREAATAARWTPGANRWDGRAAHFARMTRALDPATDPFVVAIRHTLEPTATVLDVGAGTGRCGLAVAPSVAQLTAVEPSAGMRAEFEREAAARGLKNARLVSTKWEDAQVEPHDVAFVANVLYFVADAVPFLEKLDRSARRACFILHRVEELAAALGPLIHEIRGERPPEPGFLDLYNLLFTMGIRPHAALYRPAFTVRYETWDQAVTESKQFLELDPDDTSADDRIRAALPDLLIERDGGLGFARNPQMAIIWWEKD
jgi:SAM-dependent methyltransferase